MTTASKVTLARICLIPIFLFLYLTDFIPGSLYAALALFVIASATDGIDGYIARKYNQITDFGKFIDPLADKILVASALICMVKFNQVGALAVIIIIAREFIVTGLRIAAISSGKVIAAAYSGKVKTVIQIVIICATMLVYAAGLQSVGAIKIALIVGQWIMVAITVYSGAEYMVKNWSVIDFNK